MQWGACDSLTNVDRLNFSDICTQNGNSDWECEHVMTGMTALASGYSFQLDVYYETVKWAEASFDFGCVGVGNRSISETGKKSVSNFFVSKKSTYEPTLFFPTFPY